MTATKEHTPLLRPQHSLQETPLPWPKVILIGLILFCNTFSIVVIFPFLPFMTHDFYPDLASRDIGFKAGYLGSAFSLGSLTASYLWGKLADRIGRKPVLLTGLAGTFLCILAFGFSQSFHWALLTRFMWGLLNANPGIAKTYLSEILDHSNQARGFAIIGMQAGLGRLIGPAVGGLLANPADKFEIFDTAFFRTYPYLLPCLGAAVVAFIGFIGTAIYLEETLVHSPSPKGSQQTPTYLELGLPSTPKVNHLWNRNVLISTSLYGLMGFIGVLSNEILPLWTLTSPRDGGFSFSTDQIGTMYCISAPFEVLYQLLVFPRLASRYGAIGFLVRASISFGVMIFLLPFTSWTSRYQRYIQWTVLCTAVSIMVMSRLSCFTNIFVLINNSTTQEYRARANGIGQTITAAARVLAPTLTSILFAWSEENGLGFPFNYHFVFVFAAMISVIVSAMAYSLPRTMNKPVVE